MPHAGGIGQAVVRFKKAEPFARQNLKRADHLVNRSLA